MGKQLYGQDFRAWDTEANKFVRPSFVFRLDLEGVPDYIKLQPYTGLKTPDGTKIYAGDIVYVAGIGELLVSWGTYQWVFERDDDCFDWVDVMEDLEKIVSHLYI